jgi:hypothetical protein
MPHISVTCPHCAERNEITVSELPGLSEVHCSHCHALLGTWSELVRESKGHGTTSQTELVGSNRRTTKARRIAAPKKRPGAF